MENESHRRSASAPVPVAVVAAVDGTSKRADAFKGHVHAVLYHHGHATVPEVRRHPAAPTIAWECIWGEYLGEYLGEYWGDWVFEYGHGRETVETCCCSAERLVQHSPGKTPQNVALATRSS